MYSVRWWVVVCGEGRKSLTVAHSHSVDVASFEAPSSSFVVVRRRSLSFVVRCSLFVVRRSSFVVRCSLFVVSSFVRSFVCFFVSSFLTKTPTENLLLVCVRVLGGTGINVCAREVVRVVARACMRWKVVCGACCTRVALNVA